MSVNIENSRSAAGHDRSLRTAFLFMLLPVFAGLFLLLLNSDIADSFPYLFLLPWILALALVLLIPAAFLWFRGKFGFENPLMLATFSYFIPAFVIGGISLSVGLSQPYYLSYIHDAETNLPYTVALIMLGYAGLSIGYLFPLGKRIGEIVGAYLPTKEADAKYFVFPGLLLLCFGILNSVFAAFVGLIGFQKVEEIGAYDGLILITTYFWLQGSFILWFIVFRQPTITLSSYLVIAVLLVVSVGKALFTGNRGSLFSVCIMVGLAFLLAGRKLDFRKSVYAGVLVSVAIVGGMIYGTTFRNTLGLEKNVGLERYTDNIADTIEKVASGDNLAVIEFSLVNLAERIDIVSSIAVVVSNYEQLAPYEESYGLDNNIWKDMTSFFIPRFLWHDKPVASDSQAYSDLYFNYPDNAFAITPIGDLLRNYGVPGVFLGMLLLGLLMRIIYRALIEDQPRLLWRSTLYFMLVSAISFEGFYGSILPFLVKVGIAGVVGLLLVSFLSNRLRLSEISR